MYGLLNTVLNNAENFRDGDSLSTEVVAVVSATLSFSMALLIGFASGLSVMYFLITFKMGNKKVDEELPSAQPTVLPAGPDYEEVSTIPREVIELRSNQAYGPI